MFWKVLVTNYIYWLCGIILLIFSYMCQEKLRYRTKLVPCLLGITREGVMRVDEKTKEVLKTWPFSSIRGWAATPTSLTLVNLVNFIVATY